MIIPIIMSKLPKETRLYVARNLSSDVWEVDELMDVIIKEIEAREASEHVKIGTMEKKPNSQSNNPGIPTTSTLLSKEHEGIK